MPERIRWGISADSFYLNFGGYITAVPVCKGRRFVEMLQIHQLAALFRVKAHLPCGA